MRKDATIFIVNPFLGVNEVSVHFIKRLKLPTFVRCPGTANRTLKSAILCTQPKHNVSFHISSNEHEKQQW